MTQTPELRPPVSYPPEAQLEEPAGHRPSTVPAVGKSGRGYSLHGHGGAAGPAERWPEYCR